MMTSLERIARCRDIAAALANIDPVYLPIFESMEEDYRRAEAVERAATKKFEFVGRRAKARVA